MSNRNFNASVITQRLANKAVAKNVLSNMKSGNPYFFQPQAGNFNTSVINQVDLGNSMFTSRGPTCTTIDPGCPCPISREINLTGPTPLPNITGSTAWATYLRNLGTTPTTDNIGYSIAFDSENNVYVLGSYRTDAVLTSVVNVQNVNVLPPPYQTASPITLPTTGISNSTNVYLIKYNPNGEALWATAVTGTSVDTGFSIAIDSNDNIYITGYYFTNNSINLLSANGNIGPLFQNNSNIILPGPSNSRDVFLIKYNTSGIVQWATYLSSITPTSVDEGNSIIIDNDDNVYLAGKYNSGAQINVKNVVLDINGNTVSPFQTNSPITLPSTSGIDWSFLIKYSPLGQAQWATYLGGTAQGSAKSLAIDSFNNVYITGSYRNLLLTPPTPTLFVKNVVLDINGNTVVPYQQDSPITLPNTTIQTPFMYLIKYSPTGQAQWATYLSSTGANSVGTYGNSLVIDSNFNLYVAGKYYTNAQINVQNANGNIGPTFQQNSNITLPATMILPFPREWMFLIKYTLDGLAQWATYLQGITPTSGNSLALDSYNNVYITGTYGYNGLTPLQVMNANGNIGPTFQQNSPIILPNTANLDMYLIKYSPSGEAQWATYLQGAGVDNGNFVAIDSLNNLYVTGKYSSSTDVTIINANGNIGPTFQIASSITIPNTVTTSRDAMFLIKYI